MSPARPSEVNLTWYGIKHNVKLGGPFAFLIRTLVVEAPLIH